MTRAHILEALRKGELSVAQARRSVLGRNGHNGNGHRPPRPPGSIAIIGMAGRYPGAPDLACFWENLEQGKNSIREIPRERWNVDDHYDADPSKPGKISCKWMGALDEIDCFDAAFFMTSAAEAEVMDPQYRIFLEEAYGAFEDAGYGAQALSNMKCGVYMGVMNSEYLHLLPKDQAPGLNTGNSHSIAAARISYFLNLKGPAMPIDTACSSSLVATHLACQALRNGEIEMALVGGVTLYLTPASFLGMCAAGMLSPEGQCRSFDNGANGFVPGEGAGALVLKRLEDAERDHDHIHGVILGSGINQDGRTNGITAPSVQSQIELERDVYDRFRIDPATIGYVEAHGTGTKLGDPVELEALTTVFRERTKRRSFCGLGSVKSNIGHTSAAAGMAGVQKMLLCFRNRKLVPSLNFREANAHCDFEDSPFYVNTETKPWPATATPRRAAVSSMGFSGTNAHLVLEEYVAPVESFPDDERPYVILLSARNEERLGEVAGHLLGFLRSAGRSVSMRNLAFTLQVGRDAMEERLGLVVDSQDDLAEKLEDFVNGRPTPDLHRGRVLRIRGKLAFHEADETLEKKIALWLQAGAWAKLLERWVTGLSFDWSRLYGSDRPYRVSLPTYPFARDRFWVKSNGSRPQEQTASLAKPAGLFLNDPAAMGNSFAPVSTGSRLVRLRALEIQDEVEVQERGDGILSIRVGRIADLARGFQKVGEREDAKVVVLSWDDLSELRESGSLASKCEIPVVVVRKNGSRPMPEGLGDFPSSFPGLSDDEVEAAAWQLAREISRAPRETLVCLKRHFARGAALPGRSEEAEADWLRLGDVDAPELGAPEAVEGISEVVKFEVYGNGVVLLTLCDHQSKNTFSESLTAGLVDSFERIRRTPGYKVVVLTGFGNYFACGGTKDALRAIHEGRARCTDSKVTGLPLECEIPVIAAMQGHAIGAGWSMGMFCDQSFFSEESIYHAPYLQYGFTPGAGSTLILPERLGDLGREVQFTAREYKGHELESRGMALPVRPRAKVLPQALQLAHRLALSPRETLVRVKSARARHLRARLETTYAEEVVLHGTTFVGREEVRAKIESQFGQGAAPAVEVAAKEALLDPDADAAMLGAIIHRLRETLATELHAQPEAIDTETAFIEMGLDSVNNVTWVRGLNQHYGLSLGATEVYSHPTIREFAAHVLEQGRLAGLFLPEKKTVEPAPVANPEPGRASVVETPGRHGVAPREIAVVGMAGQFPKARNVMEFWDNLVQGRDCISLVPDDRWSIADYYDADPQAPGKTYGKWMGALDDLDKFDPLFFNLSPLEAEAMDPQQRLFLEACWSCFEDAGYDPTKLSGSRCGVFAGCGPGDYGLSTDSGERDASWMMGGSLAILSARISYLLNLQGPCVAMDTACSSSLVAIASACDSLILGSSDLALAGGVGVMTGPSMHIMTSKAGMLSPDGRCFTFDQRANGFVPGEGVGVLLLKRLEDAERDGDRVYGVIRGWGVNQDGKTNGITAPNGESQARLEREVYERSRLNPEGIELFEAHGTGTKLGDPIELEGLNASFRSFTRKENFCALGSVKSNIGHLLAASGVAGAIKVLLALKHRQLPPTINFEKLNEHIRLEGSPFYVNTACREWPAPHGHPRRAAVSAFGFSGTNAHVVLEEYPEPTEANVQQGLVLVVLSAKNEDRLRQIAQNLAQFLDSAGGSSLSLREIAYTLQVGRTAMSERLGFVVGSMAELKQKLRAFVDGSRTTAFYHGRVKRGQEGNPATEEAMRGAIEKWIPAGEYEKLVELWVGGFEIDWNRLYEKTKPRRAGLPTYPFTRERYWKQKVDRPAAPVVAPRPELPEGEFGLYHPVWREAAVDSAISLPAYADHLVFTIGLDSAQVRELESRLAPSACMELPSQFGEAVTQVFERVKSLLEQKLKGKTLIQVLIVSRDEDPLALGILGLLKTAREENPRIIGQVIEVDAAGDDLPARLLENRSTPDESHIRYRAGGRMVRDWTELAPSTVTPPWRDQGIYLITGGAGGLGLIFAREIAEQAKNPTLILTGRSGLNPKIEDAVEELRARGANAVYRQVDVTDRAGVENLIDGLRREFGGLHGILHAAGINRGNFIVKKTAAEFAEVMAVKVAGTENLDWALGDWPVDFFVLFSSIAGVTGNAGQVDYAAANAFLDAFASQRQARGRTLAVNWPLWKEGGMGVDLATEALSRGHSGIVSLGTKDGILAFYRALASQRPQVAVTLRKNPGLKIEPVPVERPTMRRPEGRDLLEKIQGRLKQLLGKAINLAPDRIEADEPLESYGIDSILVSKLNVQLHEVFPEVSKTLLFEVRTLGQLAELLVGDFEAECFHWTQAGEASPVAAPKAERPAAVAVRAAAEACSGLTEPIAIIGICGRYAQAETIEDYWENLKSGRDCVAEIPRERWPLEGFFHENPEEAIRQGRSYSKWGSFLEGFSEFDPLFFNINPVEALGMDPQERLFLQSSWEVLETAGYTRARLAETIDGDVGVFAGVTKTGFDQYLADWRRMGEIATPFTSFGSIANRVSYVLNLKGPSMPIDTMCSSSLMAVHEACEQLRRGRCRMAIAGGVNLYLHSSSYVGLCAARMLSRDGKCKSFGAGGNGFVPGEGVGVVLLKPLSQALADGDPIQAIIRGTSANHGGKTNGYTVPNPSAQREVIHDALARSGVDARKVSYIEAHGTGTELGDPIEVTGLTQAFARDTSETGFCALGSAKSNLGHLEAAAGIAGLTKVVLQMKHGQLAPSLHAEAVNPNLDFARTPFALQRELADWKRPIIAGVESPRIAGVSSFGAGGANVHVVLEEAPPAPENANRREGPALIVLSAKTAERLQVYVQKLADFLSDGIDLHALAFTLQVGREAMEERVGYVVGSIPELREKLAASLRTPEVLGNVFRGRVQRGGDGLSAFYGDEDLAGTVAAWLRKGKLARLAELWVRGGSPEWELLYGGNSPRRIMAPTYPFAREKYWVDIKPAPSAGQGFLHPMVHANTSNLAGLRFSSTFSGEEFFVADHVVNGKRVLPGVACLEMVRFAARQMTRAPSDRMVIRNLVWARPISAEDFGRAVHLRLAETGDGISFSIETENADGLPSIRSQGVAAAGLETAAPVLDLPRLQAEIAERRMEGRECYAGFAEMGLDYGPSFQGIQEVFAGAGQALARLELPASAMASAEDYVLHPTLLDSAFQACGGMWLLDRGDGSGATGTFVPFAIEEVAIFGRCGSRLWAWIRTAEGAAVPKLDLDLCDEAGRICVALRGLSFRKFATGVDRREGAATLLMSPAWVAADVPAVAPLPEYAGRQVVTCGIDLPSADLGKRFEETSGRAFDLIRRLLGSGLTDGKQLVQFVIPADPEGGLLGGLVGLLKTARQENPNFVGQVIALDALDPALSRKLEENSRCPRDVQIRYVGGRREVFAWREAEAVSAPVPWKDRGVYLITGGIGGLGLIFADAIARQTVGATVILCGRAELTPEKQVQLHAMNGATIVYRRADVSRAADVERLMAEIRKEHGTLDGILHGAGLLRDRLIVNKSAGEFQEVLAPKVGGTVHLDRGSRDFDLDFFVLFSAGAGVLGNPGQADYATANAFLDEFARYRNTLVTAGQRRGVTVALDWPLWEAGGMRIDTAGIAAMKEKLGLIPLPSAAGISALAQAVASGRDQILVQHGDPGRIRSLFVRPEKTIVEFPREEDPGLETKAVGYFRELLSTTLRIPLQRIPADGLMSDLGIDSVVVMNLTNRLEEHFGALSKTLFFEHQTPRALARHFVRAHAVGLGRLFPTIQVDRKIEEAPAEVSTPISAPAVAAPLTGALDIAIIGLSGRYPGAENIDEFWEILRDGRDCITEVPAERWDWREYYSEDPAHPKGHSSKWGGFLRDIDKFDPQFFNISPRIAPYLDPQERLILEETWKVLEDAGYRREDFQRPTGDETWSPVGVYIGAMYGEYQLFGVEASRSGPRLGFAGNLASIANRVSYVLNLHGPSMMVDTMCSSSLTCLHLACQDLALGRTNYGIAGGVNLTLHPNKYSMLSGGQFLSAAGRCESFGEGGAGYIPSEGVGVALLKRLADAERDGDHIYGVIKGSSVNHGGRTHGYSVPNPKAQERVVRQALKEARIDPRSVSYVEAHGTGTKLGDPIEITALANAFGRSPRDSRCWIGSAKSNIGHCESAAGIAGLTKVLLQMRHRQIAPSLHSGVLNPHIDFESTPFVVNQALRPWERPRIDGQDGPRVAGLSSFGAGGSNAHVLIEEYRGKARSESVEVQTSPVPIVLSAKNEERLIEVVRNLREFLADSGRGAPKLPDLAYTLQTGREAMEERLGLTISSLEELEEKLDQFLQGQTRGFIRGRIDDRPFDEGAKPLEEGNLSSLLESWVEGREIDWSRLYGANPPRRISLPTYPFVRKRFWVEIEYPRVSLSDDSRSWDVPPLEKPRGVALSSLPTVSPPPDRIEPTLPEPRPSEVEQEVEPGTAAPPAVSPKALQDELLASLAQNLFLEAHELSLDKPFLDLGLDSIVGVEWVNGINKKYGLNILASQVYEHPNIRAFTEFLQGRLRPAESAAPSVSDRVEIPPPAPSKGEAKDANFGRKRRKAKATDIAIIGISGRFPGSETPDEFWGLLQAGENAFTDYPQDRGWEKADGRGGFLKDIASFDPLFFQISPKEATTMDPGERIFLQESWKAIEDAGILPAELSGRRWGVFCGNGGDYSLLIRDAVGFSPHVTLAQVPSRVSYCLNLTGPSQSVDAGCASALLAIAQACDHLILGRCEAALAGGVFIHSTPNLIVSASEVGLLAKNGAGGRALDRSAEGMTPSEAAGVVVLKPLADALSAEDRIYGVIEGWGSNHNGKTNGMVSPNVESQEALVSEIYRRFEIDPGDINFIEANASGLPLADAAEIQALARVFQKQGGRSRALGSVENNVGHAFHAAGINHVMKVLLGLQHRRIPAMPNVENPTSALEDSPFFVNAETIPWEVESGQSRRAAISSYGATGVNVHLVIVEAPAAEAGEPASAGPVLIPLSAKTATGLKQRCCDLADQLEDQSLRRLSANLLLRRTHFEHRCAVVVADSTTLKSRLREIAEVGEAEDSFLGHVDPNRRLGPSLSLLAESKMKALLAGASNAREDLAVLADLFVQGVTISAAACFSDSERRPLALPAYPFEKRRCWIDAPSRPSPKKPRETPIDPPAALDALVGFIGEITDLAREEIDPGLSLSEYGIDSLLGMRLLNRINARFGGGFDASLLARESIRDTAEEITLRGNDVGSGPHHKISSDGDRVRPGFIESVVMEVAGDSEGIKSNLEPLERLMAHGVGVWREESKLCFEFLEKTRTRATLEQLVGRPEGLHAALTAGERYFPASEMQRFALHESEVHKRPTFNLCQGFWIDLPVSLEALNAALAGLVRRHSVFRTGARRIGRQWMQVVHETLVVECREVSWPKLETREAFEAELIRFQHERNRELFDIGRAPLLDVYFLHNGKDLGAVFLCAHHFHADGFTLYFFQQELYRRYVAAVENRPFELPPSRAEYAHFALSQFAPERASIARYWLDKMAGKRAAGALRDQSRHLDGAEAGSGIVERTVAPDLLEHFREFNRKNQTTLTQLVAGALAALLFRLTGSSHPIQLVYNLRDRAEFEGLFGDFSSSVPMLLPIDQASTVRTILQSYRDAALEIQRRKHFDFSTLLQSEDAFGLFGDVALDSNDRDTFGEVTDFAGRLIDLAMEDRVPVAPLLVCVVKTHGRTTLPLIHDRSRLSRRTVELFADNLMSTLGEMLRNLDWKIGDLEIFPELQSRLSGRDRADDPPAT